MKRPAAPAPFETLLERHSDRLPALVAHGVRPTVEGRYLHWDELRRRYPPTGLTRAEWWTGIKLSRVGLSRLPPLRDVRGRPFSFMLPDGVQEALHRIDSRAHGRIGIGDEVVNRETRDRFIIDSLIREAITSSQLEGAATTRAFLRAGTDGNDLTYFIVHQIDVILRALDALDEYVGTKTEQVRQVERMLRRSSDLNHRQLALLAHALRHPGAEYTTRSHRTSHAVAYATARADLFRLAELEWLERRRVGRRDNVFRAPPDLAARIRRR